MGVITSSAFANTEQVHYLFTFVLSLKCFNQGDLHFNVPRISIQRWREAERHAGLMDVLLFAVSHGCVEDALFSAERQLKNKKVEHQGRSFLCAILSDNSYFLHTAVLFWVSAPVNSRSVLEELDTDHF